MDKMINIFQPSLGEEELKAVREVFASNWIGKGDKVLEFERRFAESQRIDPKHFLTTTCCTEGLFLAGRLFKWKPGDEIIAPTVSFNAVGSAVMYYGAKLVLCDVDPRTLNTNSGFIKEKITPRTKAVILNHYGGVPCDMDPILKLCRSRNIVVIEDSACAVHSFYKGRAAGTLGDMGVWSFDAMKVVCTGDGGMIYLKDPKRVVEAKEWLYMGLPNKQKSGMDSSTSGASAWWEFEVNRPGRRAIMNNIAGSIGVVQMKKLPKFLKRRKAIHEMYNKGLSKLSWLQLPPPLNPDTTVSHYFYWVQLEKRDELARFMLDRGIYTTYRYWPLHKVKFFNSKTDLINADLASRRTLNIPLHHGLTDREVQRVIAAIKDFGKLL
ncbi:MAG: DegT/DnrJ/EryC1/StrS family aminotransferase [Candidatus Colwellbacteria bacterium]